ncbi:MAG TPA: serine hydrolase [Longimicrobiaceae bacterium]|nr:serine hydrolase [Longimicrobiaceae bacterium]
MHDKKLRVRGLTIRTAFHFLTCATLTTACAAPPSGASPPGRGSAAPLLDPFLERMFAELRLVPGMAVAVVRDTAVVYLRGFGVADVSSGAPVTPRTLFYIASSTKSFTGTAAAILEAKGVWDLDDPLSRWLPEASLPAPLSADSATLRQLLSHTSRIENGAIVFRTAYSGEHDRRTLIDLLAQSDVLEPGFDYGNVGYVVASLAMDAASNGSWKDVLEREIFAPLGMGRTSANRSAADDRQLALPHGVDLDERFEVRPYIKTDANMHAAGGMVTTAEDLARWLEANLNGGRLDGRQALPEAAVREAQRMQATTDAEFYRFAREGYGLGWYHGRYEGDVLVHHFGNYPGFRAHVSFMPEHGLGVAVLTNESAQGYFVPEVVAAYVYDRLREKPGLEEKYDSAMAFLRNDAARVRKSIERDRERRAARPESLALPPAAYVGTYRSPTSGSMEIRQSGPGRLEARIGVLGSPMEPVDVGGRQLRVELVPGSGAIVSFFIGAGRADSLMYNGAVFRLDRSAGAT